MLETVLSKTKTVIFSTREYNYLDLTEMEEFILRLKFYFIAFHYVDNVTNFKIFE
jgi:hypothetical protein